MAESNRYRMSASRLEELKYDTEKMTVKEYAELIVNDNKFDTEIKEDGTFVYFEHVIKNTDDADETFKYFSAVYKSDEAFWLIHFGCTEENYDTNRESFATYAKSVSFQ